MQIRFGPFTLDLDTRQLIRAGSAAEVLGKTAARHTSSLLAWLYSLIGNKPINHCVCPKISVSALTSNG